MKTKYKAVQFRAPETAEVSGVILMAYLNNLEEKRVGPILKSYGFDKANIDTERWYPNQMFLDIERSIYQSEGGANALVAIGKSAVENYIPPAGVETLEDALMALPSVYTTNQRKLPEGYGWFIEKVGPQQFVFKNNTGTSNHGAYGYVWALCNKLKPAGANMSVVPTHGFSADDDEPAIIEIEW